MRRTRKARYSPKVAGTDSLFDPPDQFLADPLSLVVSVNRQVRQVGAKTVIGQGARNSDQAVAVAGCYR